MWIADLVLLVEDFHCLRKRGSKGSQVRLKFHCVTWARGIKGHRIAPEIRAVGSPPACDADPRPRKRRSPEIVYPGIAPEPRIIHEGDFNPSFRSQRCHGCGRVHSLSLEPENVPVAEARQIQA